MENDKIKTSRASQSRVSRHRDQQLGLHHHLWMHHLRQTDLGTDG
jgi:hypothetical protein